MLNWTQRPLYSFVCTLLLLFFVVINTPSMAAATGTELPAGLTSPHQGVLCNEKVRICYDSKGVSPDVTREFMGSKAADRLAQELSLVNKQSFDFTNFNPALGVSCHVLEKACYLEDIFNPALSSALFGPNAGNYGPEILPGTTWAWNSSQYNNDTEARPEDSSRYTISFKADGVIGIRADCNIVQGSYTTEDKSLLIQLGPSTMAACGPKSLDQQFLRDLAGAAVWFLQKGNLYLDLKADAGTMKFYRLLE